MMTAVEWCVVTEGAFTSDKRGFWFLKMERRRLLNRRALQLFHSSSKHEYNCKLKLKLFAPAFY